MTASTTEIGNQMASTGIAILYGAHTYLEAVAAIGVTLIVFGIMVRYFKAPFKGLVKGRF